MKAIDAYEEDLSLPPEEMVIKAINNSDATLAKKICNDYGII
jgi:hypothetical protein